MPEGLATFRRWCGCNDSPEHQVARQDVTPLHDLGQLQNARNSLKARHPLLRLEKGFRPPRVGRVAIAPRLIGLRSMSSFDSVKLSTALTGDLEVVAVGSARIGAAHSGRGCAVLM